VLTEKYLNEIEQRVKKASIGPWSSYVEGRDHLSGSNFIMTGPSDNRGDDIELLGATIADQDFIAHARADIQNLIEELKRLKNLVYLLDFDEED
jgi:hypothetical protein